MKSLINLKVKKLSDDAIIPKKAHEGDACHDIYSIDEYIVIDPFEGKFIHTGLAFEIPVGYEVQIRPRSGLASLGLIIPNAPATIDENFRGEIKIKLWNISKEKISISKHSRVAQMCIKPVFNIDFELTEKLSETDRGEGGFGSSGV